MLSNATVTQCRPISWYVSTSTCWEEVWPDISSHSRHRQQVSFWSVSSCLSDRLCPACRYNNKPWGDCDPLLLLRTKHVTLVKDSRYRWVVQTSDSTNTNSHLSSHEDCLETREFSQTCTSEDLTSGNQTSDNYRLQQYSLLFKEAGS